MQALSGFFATVKLVLTFWNEVKALVSYLQTAEENGWYAKGSEIRIGFKNAKTDKEQFEWLRRLSDHGQRLP